MRLTACCMPVSCALWKLHQSRPRMHICDTRPHVMKGKSIIRRSPRHCLGPDDLKAAASEAISSIYSITTVIGNICLFTYMYLEEKNQMMYKYNAQCNVPTRNHLYLPRARCAIGHTPSTTALAQHGCPKRVPPGL